MPFKRGGQPYTRLYWDHVRILQTIRETYPGIGKYPIPHFQLHIIIIFQVTAELSASLAAYTRSFCGTCNRIRITPHGLH
jgi:cyclic pyranopterin phosphate synthase